MTLIPDDSTRRGADLTPGVAINRWICGAHALTVTTIIGQVPAWLLPRRLKPALSQREGLCPSFFEQRFFLPAQLVLINKRSPVELTILMPCLNEANTVAACVRAAKGYLAKAQIDGEVVVADNGSTDGSVEIAAAAGARVIHVPVRGYGAALMAGIDGARGSYVIMGDADCSYDFSRLDPYVDRLRAGADLVMGNRFKGGIEPGAMPPLHRYLGNPVLSFVGRLFFRIRIGDFHCGLRGFSRQAIQRLGLVTPGMEFASEMVAKAALARLAYRGGPDHPAARWSRPPAASAHLARRLAAPALSAAVLPALAVSVPRCGDAAAGPGGVRPPTTGASSTSLRSGLTFTRCCIWQVPQ